MSRQILISFKSDYIVNFAIKNGISFPGQEPINLTKRNTIGGDLRPPILGVEAFLELLKRRRDLFTQKEYADFYLKILNARYKEDWSSALLGAQEKYNSNGTMSVQEYRNKRLYAFECRAKSQFYVSMIDTLHAWALLQEAKWYDVCYIDSVLDATAKTDLTMIRSNKKIRVALYGPRNGEEHYNYKVIYRNNGQDLSGIHQFKMPWDRQKIANKRWYKLSDFLPIKPKDVEFETAIELPLDYPVFPTYDDEMMEAILNQLHHAPYIYD